MESHLRLKRFLPSAGLKPRTTSSAGKHLTTELLGSFLLEERKDQILSNKVDLHY